MENTAYRSCAPGEAWHSYFPASRLPVNVEEREDAFILQLFAPALAKDRFSVSAHNDVLYIAYEAPEDGPRGRFTVKEYDPKKFHRSFRLNGKVDVERIEVSYRDGILNVILPRVRR